MFIDSANVIQIKDTISLGIVEGITTNPSILKSAKTNELLFANDLKRITNVPVYFQLRGSTADDYINYFNYLKSELPIEFGIKIPVDYEGVKAIATLRKADTDLPILGTVIYTVAQAILAIEAGCNYLAPYYNRILQEGTDSNEVITKIRWYIDNQESSCKIMAASFKTTDQVVSALIAGAHTCTLPVTILSHMLENKSVFSDINAFNSISYAEDDYDAH